MLFISHRRFLMKKQKKTVDLKSHIHYWNMCQLVTLDLLIFVLNLEFTSKYRDELEALDFIERWSSDFRLCKTIGQNIQGGLEIVLYKNVYVEASQAHRIVIHGLLNRWTSQSVRLGDYDWVIRKNRKFVKNGNVWATQWPKL